MDNQRLILFVALSFVILLIWQAWEQDFGSHNVAHEPASTVAETGSLTKKPSPETPPSQDIPDVKQVLPESAETAAAPPPEEPERLHSGRRIHVLTDVLDIEIDTIGGDLRRADLRKYPISVDQPDKAVRLMDDSKSRIFVAQTGLISNDRDRAPDHHAVFTAAKQQFSLPRQGGTLVVPLHWTGPDGIVVDKTYTFHRESYVIDVSYRVHNPSSHEWRARFYRQMQRTAPKANEKSRFIYSFTGGAIYSEQEKYEKISFDDMADQDLDRDIRGGWAAIMEHYFVGAWVPDQTQLNHYYSKALADGRYVLGLVSPEIAVSAGQDKEFNSRLYVGPKILKRLEKVAPGLELSIDYGILTVIAKPLFWLMNYIHQLIGNWGWSIVFVTFLIKLAFYKLSEHSYKSMANMRRLQPKITALRERYKEDRQRMSQAMMELYKKEKINPLGGCLPMIAQIPVFIALYWVLLESVELRQADFALWIHDLSTKDPYYVLPLLMGITMFLQQRLNPPPPDPIQAKIMMGLPVIFTLFFAFFPSGLVLYWVTNSVLSIAQQWMITRRIERSVKHA